MDIDTKRELDYLDYTALETPLTREDVRIYKKAYIRPWSVLQKIMTATVTISILFLIVHFGILVWDSDVQLIIFMACIIAITVAIPTVVVYATYKKRRLQARLFKFSKANKLTLQLDAPVNRFMPSLRPAGMIFGTGHSEIFKERVVFSTDVEVGNFRYETGSGKSRRVYDWGYARFKLSRRLPNIVLDAKANNKWFVSNLDVAFTQSQRLSLEGDFDTYFSLYTPDDYKRDALYIFTPDVMSVMVDYGRDFDIELVDDELLIYAKGSFKLDKKATYQNLSKIGEAIYSRVERRAEKYTDERVGDRTANIVAPDGRRLRKKVEWLSIVILITFLYLVYVHPYVVRLFDK